jgi:hypothetical protein
MHFRAALLGIAAMLVCSVGPGVLPCLARAAYAATPGHGAAVARPDSATGLRPVPARAAPALARTDTLLLGDEPREPRATYGSFAAACESLTVLLRRALGTCADSLEWTRGRTESQYRDSLTLERAFDGRPMWSIEPRNAWVQSLSVRLFSSNDTCPDYEAIARALEGAGWSQNSYYSADGADGSDFAFFCREALCLLQVAWDGGDDSDSTYVPKPGYSFGLTCVPRPEENPAYRRAWSH